VIVVVAPVLRFKDVGFNANVTLEDLGQYLLTHPACAHAHISVMPAQRARYLGKPEHSQPHAGCISLTCVNNQ
jgi:hypothetical protein